MAYPYYNYSGLPYNQTNYQPVPDQLQQLRGQQMPLMQTQMPGTSDDRIFVQGELAAQAYLVAPNSFVRLWDSTSNTFYEKRADASGRPYMEAYEYKLKTQEKVTQTVPDQTDKIDYMEKINALEKRIMVLEKKGSVTNDAKPKSSKHDTTVSAVQTDI